MGVCVCVCVRACWNFLPPNFVKSEPKREDVALHAAARRAFVKLLAVLSSSELQPIRSLFWFLLFSRSTVGFLAPRTLLSVRGELRAAWRRPRCDFLSTPLQPQTQFTPFFPPLSLLARLRAARRLLSLPALIHSRLGKVNF